jgi:cyclophilin family peptidyl-prolyl cis-trans isomerase
MVHTRSALLLTIAALTACGQQATTATPRLQADASPQQRPSTPVVDARASPVVDSCSREAARTDGGDLLDLGFEDGLMDQSDAQRCLASLSNTDPRSRREARLFLLARRLPTNNMAALWDAVRPAERSLVLRAIAGRPRAGGTVTPPATWERSPTEDLLSATIVNRFRLAQTPTPEDAARATVGLGSADPERQLAAARWLRMVSWTPTLDDLSTVTAHATPALVRSLAEGPGAATIPWAEWMTFVARRAHLAPRLWGNAWRALRDGIPDSAITATNTVAWTAMIDALPRVRGLSGEALAWFECEDAFAIDRWTARAERTGRCASGSEGWIALTMRARVLGKMRGNDAARARELGLVRREAQGRAQVLCEVATSASSLARAQALPLLTTLARERDAGLLAALIEGLVDHPELARAMDASARDALIRAPFEAPEGPTLEARVQAIKLARLLHREELVAAARQSSVRVLRRTIDSDAGVIAGPPGQLDEGGATRVRFVTDAGSFVIELDAMSAPRAVANVRAVVRERRYDGLRWHRVVSGFVTQGGDPRGDGYGGTDVPVATELALRPFDRGAVGVPLAGLDTGGMQLFVVTADAPSLDARFPWVGRVVQGMEVVDGVLPGDRIVRAEFVEVSD